MGADLKDFREQRDFQKTVAAGHCICTFMEAKRGFQIDSEQSSIFSNGLTLPFPLAIPFKF